MNNRQTNLVEEIFLELVDLPEPDRAARLRDRCGHDSHLCARVQKLLSADAENEQDGTWSGPAAEFGAEPIPSRVGNYAVHAVLGEGGMGAVYDAIHEPTNRRAALKLIRAGIATSSGRERFRIEAETLGRLNDPAVAQMYDAGLAEVTWPEGAKSRRPFIAMEFVENAMSISEYARSTGLATRERIKLIEQVARAVHHAHQRGVIHRDLKPGNVLINRSTAEPKIVDFGIARLVDATADGITVTGQVVGTVRYMSPEQAGGDPKLIDTRTDIYSLGAILYELLAERPIIESESGIGGVMQLLNTAPKRLASLKPQLSGDVDAIVHKAIERNADERYASAAAFADDLQRFLDGHEVSARAPTTVERFVRVVRNNKAKVAAIVIVLLSLVGGAIGATWGMMIAKREAGNARAAEADATAYGDFLERRILATARPKDMQGGLGLDATIVEALRVAESKIEHDFAGRAGAEALTRHAIGVTWRQRGDFDAAEKQFRRAIELAEGAFGPNHAATLNMRNSLQVLLEQAQRRGQDLSEPERILKNLEETAGPRDPLTITARYNLAIYRAKAGQSADALKLLQQVYEDRIAVLGANSLDALVTISDIAELHQHLGQSERAQQLQRELIDKLTSRLGPDNPQTLNARYRLACLLKQNNQHEMAVEMFEQVIPELRKSLGDESVTTLDALVQLAQSLMKLQQYSRAVPLFREYAQGQGKLMGPRSSQTALLFKKITIALLNVSQPAAAEEFARKLFALQNQLAPDAPGLFESQCLLGECLEGSGQRAEAETLLTEGLAGLDRQASLSPPLQARQQSAQRALVRIFESTARPTQAEALRIKLAATQPTTRP